MIVAATVANALLETALAKLDGSEAALVFASGMAAGLAVLQSPEAGDRVPFPDDAYYAFSSPGLVTSTQEVP